VYSFRGTPSGKGSHDEVARRIASNGQCWVERSEWYPSCVSSNSSDYSSAWRREDLQSYMFRLYLEYARLISPDRDNGKMVSGKRCS
jgi:beta-1,2-xylosyltransferase